MFTKAKNIHWPKGAHLKFKFFKSFLFGAFEAFNKKIKFERKNYDFSIFCY